MARREFSRSIKLAVIKRATRDGLVLCEGCGALTKKWQIDHRRADGLLGEPTLENAQLLGPCCYGPKNAADTTAIAQAKRREARHVGARTVPVKPLVGAPFPVSERTAGRQLKPSLPPRKMYEDAK